MTTNFIPEKGDEYYYATRTYYDSYMWEGDSIDIRIAKRTGIFPYTPDGRRLAVLQHAFFKETSMFWEWVDDYELHA